MLRNWELPLRNRSGIFLEKFHQFIPEISGNVLDVKVHVYPSILLFLK